MFSHIILGLEWVPGSFRYNSSSQKCLHFQRNTFRQDNAMVHSFDYLPIWIPWKSFGASLQTFFQHQTAEKRNFVALRENINKFPAERSLSQKELELEIKDGGAPISC